MENCCCSSENKMMTVDDVADYIQMSKTILYKGIREKSLGIPHIKINKAVRFFKSDVDAWVNMLRENTGPQVVAAINAKKTEGACGNPK